MEELLDMQITIVRSSAALPKGVLHPMELQPPRLHSLAELSAIRLNPLLKCVQIMPKSKVEI